MNRRKRVSFDALSKDTLMFFCRVKYTRTLLSLILGISLYSLNVLAFTLVLVGVAVISVSAL